MRIILLAILLSVCGVARAQDAIPATAYFPILPFEAASDTNPQFVPVAVNHPLDEVHTGVTRAIIIIHDQNRDANNALASLSALAGTASATTMILAPQFLLPSDIARFANVLPDKGKAFAAWDINGWKSGDDSVAASGYRGISSFTVIDLLLMYLGDETRFPDLKNITITGYGAGAGFVQHYAGFGLALKMMEARNINVRFLVADAPFYLYLTANRPLGDSKNVGGKGFGRPDNASCPDMDNYPYGMQKLNSYARRVGANEAKTGYGLRFITYLNQAAPDALPETNCAAIAQGRDNYARAANYNLYLQSLYGEVAAKTQNFVSPQAGGKDAVALFGSLCGMNILFGDGVCSPALE